MKLHLGRSEDPRIHVNPSAPHAFVEVRDVGIAAAAAGGAQGTRGAPGGLTQVVVTDNYLRKSRCGVDGCGRERSDPIHAAPED